MKTIILCAGIALLSACGSGGGSSGNVNPPPVQPLSKRFAIDGVVDFNGLSTVNTVLSFNDSVGHFIKSTNVTYAVTNDDKDLYVALSWTDNTFDHDVSSAGFNVDGVRLMLDSDNDGQFAGTDDNKILVAATAVGSLYRDQHLCSDSSGACDDAIGDGRGKLHYDAGHQQYSAEFLLPLQADHNGQDGMITATTRFNMILIDHLQPGAGSFNSAPLFVGSGATSAWQMLPIQASGAIVRPQIPGDLNGSLIFISDHANPNGDIYRFEPATGVITRLTNSPMFKDNVTLSHDRQWIAFTGANSATDYASYEVYKIKSDGTGLVQLTHNSLLDGHPGWSPDDNHIVFASFRSSDRASLIVIDTEGNELANLTPPSANDNDPDYSADGRIIFKTDRFAPSPTVKLASMNADGSDVRALTSLTTSPASSDHDPIAHGNVAVFERFMKGTDYSTDIETPYSAWNLIEARLDGSGERTLLADGWVNWLPVFDPSGRYVAHLKSVGYTDVHLLNTNGDDLGRLLPGMTQVRYIDWK